MKVKERLLPFKEPDFANIPYFDYRKNCKTNFLLTIIPQQPVLPNQTEYFPTAFFFSLL